MSAHVHSQLIFFLSVVGNFLLVLSVVRNICRLCRWSVNPIHTLVVNWRAGCLNLMTRNENPVVA